VQRFKDQTLKTWLFHRPDDESLTHGIASILAVDSEGVSVIKRVPNPHASTFPSEVVICRRSDGTEFQLFCKYQTARDNLAHGHRGGVKYEAGVYRRVLASSGVTAPPFYGAAVVGADGQCWLLLGYLKSALRLRDSHHLSHWEQCAAWCGRFHAHFQSHSGDGDHSFLHRYELDYYAGWARRTVEYADGAAADFPWVRSLCDHGASAFGTLLDAPQTVIHGEYYSKNLLVYRGIVYPVDWESTAIAPGEIDLATLTDGCEPEVVRRCEDAYQRARWPDGTPPHFPTALDLARLYVHFRWLGDQPGHRMRRRFWRYEEVRRLGERLGLL
jgi:hypothetical protein